MKLPDLTAKVCARCLNYENGEDWKERCPDDPDGQHDLRRRELWAGLLIDDFWGITSKREAMNTMGELCYDGTAYIEARKLKPREVEALRAGKAKLVIAIVEVEA